MRKGLTIGLVGLLFIALGLALFSFTRNSEKKKNDFPLSHTGSYQPNLAYLHLLSSSKAIARIGSTELTGADLKDYLQNTSGNSQSYHFLSEADLSVRIQEGLDGMIEDELLAQEASHRGIHPSSANGQQRHELADKLIQDQASMQPQITDAEERAFYKNHGEKFTLAPSNQVREIFIPFTLKDDLKLKIGPAYGKAKNLEQKVRGGESMESLARRYFPKSVEKAAGYTFTGAVMDGNDAATVLNLNPGVVAGPFRVEGGLSIFQGISRIPQRFIPFYRAQPIIHRYLEEQRLLLIRRKLVDQLSQKILVRKLEPSTGKL